MVSFGIILQSHLVTRIGTNGITGDIDIARTINRNIISQIIAVVRTGVARNPELVSVGIILDCRIIMVWRGDVVRVPNDIDIARTVRFERNEAAVGADRARRPGLLHLSARLAATHEVEDQQKRDDEKSVVCFHRSVLFTAFQPGCSGKSPFRTGVVRIFIVLVFVRLESFLRLVPNPIGGRFQRMKQITFDRLGEIQPAHVVIDEQDWRKELLVVLGQLG